MPKSSFSKIHLLSLFIISISLITALFNYDFTYASDKCAGISDLDDRAKCYENKIEDKQEEYESTSKKLSDIRSKKDSISSTIAKYQSELNVTQAQINDLQNDIDEVKKQLDEIESLLTDRKGKLSQKIDFRNRVIRNYSKRNVVSDLEMFFSVNPLNSNLNGFEYASFTYMVKKYLTKDALRLIHLLNSEIDTYQNDKAEAQSLHNELADTQNELLSLKSDLANKKSSAQNEFGDLADKQKDYEDDLFDLEEEIDELTSKQQAILNQKYGEGSGSVGDYEAPESKTPGAPFSPAFAAFSYGAYTHYKGMSQYGAKGRADNGASYKDILKFYYKNGIKEVDADEICVEGKGTMDFQKYLYGIAEMPSDWHSQALKAQAVAARSYAYRYVKQGKCICTSQSCQVFLSSKSDNPPSRWKDAVDSTEGEILEGDVVAYYSSTTGGYIDNIGWDVKSKWPDSAFEKIAKSPWFRKAWYTKSYSDSNNCGRSHPWLNQEEMADIINAWRVWVKGSSSEKSHISPVTTSCWGGDPYSLSEMKDVSSKYGGGYNKVKSIKADIGDNGYTTKVSVETDKGSFSIDGQTFKTVYNLRAPSYIAIRSRLFDFEKDD